MHLSQKLKNKIGFIVSFIFGVLILFTSFLNLNDDYENRRIIGGTFKQLSLKKPVKGGHYYVLNINEFKNDFLISNLYLKAFNNEEFVSNVKQGDHLSIMVDNELNLKKNNGEALGIKSENIQYIDQKTWRKIKRSNGNIGILLGIIFIGISIYFFKRRDLRNN